jgi:hypothetical protein
MQLKSAILPGSEAFKTNETGHLAALREVSEAAAAAAEGISAHLDVGALFDEDEII